MVLIKPILFCLMLLSWSSHGSKPSESSIGYESVEEALNAMKNSPGAAVRYENGWTVVNFQNKRILWLFTPEDHPAHPSAVKREVVHNDKGISLDMNVSCKSTKEACDQLVEEFELLNESIRQKMRLEN